MNIKFRFLYYDSYLIGQLEDKHIFQKISLTYKKIIS